MKIVVLALMLASPGVAMAQSLLASPPSMNGPNYTTWGNDKGAVLGWGITPTMRREQVQRAVALRTEVAALKSEDGGALTPEHIAYVQRKVDAIRNFHH